MNQTNLWKIIKPIFNKNTINGVAKVAHHEERAMPEKVTLASQRNLNDIPHRSEGLKSPPKQKRQEFI